MEQEQQKRYRAWAEIDLNALTHNVQTCLLYTSDAADE